MVGIKILGLLGNHLFQVAFMYHLKEKYGYDFFIEYGTVRMNKPRLEKYFDLPNYNYYSNKLNQLWYTKIKPITNRIEIDINLSPNTELNKIQDNAIYEGFVQSEIYFNSIKNIHSIFKIKKKYTNKFQQKYSNLFRENKTIVVHIRRGDYTENGWLLPMMYYEKALQEIENKNDYKIIFVSDDMEFVKTHFGNNPNYLFISDSEIMDFQIIQHGDIIITANSTFSWWGAYLNQKKNKEVFAPKNWLGFKENIESPKGIMSINWKWINF